MNLDNISSTVKVPASLDSDFFKLWLTFLKPFHHLTEREIDLATAFLKKRYELSKSISDDELLDKIVLNDDYKREIKNETKVTNTHFQVIMGKLRASRFIVDNKINPRFIPRVKNESDPFLLLVYFDFSKQVVIEKLTPKKKDKEPEPIIDKPKRGRKRKIKEENVEELTDNNIDLDFDGGSDIDDGSGNQESID